MEGKGLYRCFAILLLVAMALPLWSCHKEVPPKFSGDNFLFFMNRIYYDNLNTQNVAGSYTENTAFSFYQVALQEDTLRMNQSAMDWPLYIQADGRLSSQNRPVVLEITGNGRSFCVLPDPDSVYIPVNQFQYKLNMKIVRPPLSDTGTKSITLILKNNDYFKPEDHVWSTVNYTFGNILYSPGLYDMVKGYYGSYSRGKIYAIVDAVNKAGKSYWDTDPNVNTLNQVLAGGRQMNFDPYSIDEFFYFIDGVQNLPQVQTPGPVQDAYNGLTTTIVALAKQLAADRKAAGNPYLDDAGNAIVFP